MRIPGLEMDIDASRVPWRGTRDPGIEWFLLASEAELAGARGAASGATVLIRMRAGHGYAPHRHLDVEEVLVLAGGYRDHLGEHRAGSYLRYPPGSTHAPVALGDASLPPGPENPDCVLFAVARGGIELLRDPSDLEV